MSVSTDGKILIWEESLKYPLKGYTLNRKKDGFMSIIGALCVS